MLRAGEHGGLKLTANARAALMQRLFLVRRRLQMGSLVSLSLVFPALMCLFTWPARQPAGTLFSQNKHQHHKHSTGLPGADAAYAQLVHAFGLHVLQTHG